MKKYLTFLFVLVLGLFLFLGVKNKESPKEVNYNYLPLLVNDCVFVERSYCSLCYNKKHEQSVERITCIDFFNVLPEKVEVELERAAELGGWF